MYPVFFFALIACIIAYSIKKKFYPLLYVLSGATYIFTAGYVIDAYDLGKEMILLVLFVSAVIMLAMGYYLSKRK